MGRAIPVLNVKTRMAFRVAAEAERLEPRILPGGFDLVVQELQEIIRIKNVGIGTA